MWSCRPLLTEADYSENSYTIHAISKLLDPILTYSQWPLKRAWSEQISKSSQNRKSRIGSVNLGKKPDLQVLLTLDMKESEVILVEISRLFPQKKDKGSKDWKKLVRMCKDSFDERRNTFFENIDSTSDAVKPVWDELDKIPIIGIQVIGDRISASMLDFLKEYFIAFIEYVTWLFLCKFLLVRSLKNI
jgi:hypothetical protein